MPAVTVRVITTVRYLRLFCLIVATSIPQSFAAPAYVITDLGAGIAPTAINTSGQIVGNWTPNGSLEAFLYSAGTMVGLGAAGDGYSVALGLSDSGQVVGEVSTRAWRPRIQLCKRKPNIARFAGSRSVRG